MRKPLACAPKLGSGRVLPSFMICSVETSFHVPTMRSRTSDSVWPATNEPQSTNATRINVEFPMVSIFSRVRFAPSQRLHQRDCEWSASLNRQRPDQQLPRSALTCRVFSSLAGLTSLPQDPRGHAAIVLHDRRL